MCSGFDFLLRLREQAEDGWLQLRGGVYGGLEAGDSPEHGNGHSGMLPLNLLYCTVLYCTVLYCTATYLGVLVVMLYPLTTVESPPGNTPPSSAGSLSVSLDLARRIKD